MREAVGPWAVSRLLVVLSIVVAEQVKFAAGPLRPTARRHLAQLLLGWDAERYMQLARHGYRALPRTEVRFFPLVPLLARLGDRVLPGGPGAALVVEANIAALVFGVLVYRLVVHEKGDPTLGQVATWLVYLTPAAFVLAWGYTEPLWGCFTVGMFLALRQRRWWLAALAGVLAGLTRPVAPLLCLPALIEALRDAWPVRFRLPWRDLVARAAAVASPVVGVSLFLAWVGHEFGDFKLPYTIQQDRLFRGSFTDPFRPLWHTAALAVQQHRWIYGVRLVWAVALIAALVAVFRRWPAPYGAYAAAAVLVALCTRRLGSFERYTFTAFPIVLAIALVAKERRAVTAVAAVGAAAMVAYGTLALLGGYVP